MIQPRDQETRFILYALGFREVELLPQLLYRDSHELQLPELFVKLSQSLNRRAQSESRYMVTQSPLNSLSLPTEFLGARPLSSMVLSIKNAWFFQVLAQHRLFFHYQPIFNLGSGQVVAHECLVRGLDEQGQQLSGQQLIDAALVTDSTHEFDCFARKACFEALGEICNGIDGSHVQQLVFFVNVLPNAIAQDPASLERNCQQVIDLGLRPEQIVFELTEVESLGHHPHLPQLVNRIQSLGFKLALDDLGSNLALDHYFMEFHPDVIKLDRRLVHDCSHYRAKQMMVKSLYQCAHELGITVLAEGLQGADDIDFCRELGIELGQGFGLALPEGVPWLSLTPMQQGGGNTQLGSQFLPYDLQRSVS